MPCGDATTVVLCHFSIHSDRYKAVGLGVLELHNLVANTRELAPGRSSTGFCCRPRSAFWLSKSPSRSALQRREENAFSRRPGTGPSPQNFTAHAPA